MKTLLSCTACVVLVLVGVLTGCASQAADSAWPGYRTDSQDNLVKNKAGQCWRTVQWKPEMAVPECDVALTGEPETAPVVTAAKDAAPVPLPTALNVTFAFNAATLSPLSKNALQAWYQRLPQDADLVVEVHGYSDPLGSDFRNAELARQRSQAVAQWWESQGPFPGKLRTFPHGEDHSVTGQVCKRKPVSERMACYAPDRRVTLLVFRP